MKVSINQKICLTLFQFLLLFSYGCNEINSGTKSTTNVKIEDIYHHLKSENLDFNLSIASQKENTISYHIKNKSLSDTINVAFFDEIHLPNEEWNGIVLYVFKKNKAEYYLMDSYISHFSTASINEEEPNYNLPPGQSLKGTISLNNFYELSPSESYKCFFRYYFDNDLYMESNCIIL